MRAGLEELYRPYVTGSDRSHIMNVLRKKENWFYDEGENQIKSGYVARVDGLKGNWRPGGEMKKKTEKVQQCAEEKMAYLDKSLGSLQRCPTYQDPPITVERIFSFLFYKKKVIVAVYACGVDVEKGPIRQQLWNAPPCDNVESWFGAQSRMIPGHLYFVFRAL
ncbi:hypothetical protein LAZ67_21001459 [Cordylochernes scorpioides]|uniref:Uncharacterized protein n=1 Tax=Cordylochernes scorpioides TaxID=51811 RepID=A0ABY6LNU2_9ARAC|nr:hypothetical protein LAZ67_21001459 [Cordylochernes scorpioides]